VTGQELLELQSQKIFRPAQMDAIISEFVPDPDSLKLQKAFMPYKEVNRSDIIALIKAGAFGMTNPVYPGGTHVSIGLPTYSYIETHPGHWRESVKWDEEVLGRIKNPEKPDQLWGDGLMGSALNMMDLRLNTLQEYTSIEVVQNRSFSVAKNGVNYTYNPNLPAKYYLYAGATGSVPTDWMRKSWGTDNANQLWSDLDDSHPITDIREAVQYARTRLGINPTEIWMSSTVAGYIEDNTKETQVWTQNNPAFAGKMVTAESLIPNVASLKGLVPKIDDRRYLIETGLRTAQAAAAGAAFQVADADGFEIGDIVTLRNKTGGEEDVTLTAVSVANRTITTTDTFSENYAVGDRATASKPYLDTDKIILRCDIPDRAPRSNWISTPSLIKAKSFRKGIPGRYTWTTFHTEVPYWVEVGAGVDGGPQVYYGGGWLVLKVAGT